MRARDIVLISLMMIATVVLLPLLIPAGFVVVALENRRRRKAARSFSCVRCGKLLGAESVELPDEAWREHMSELRRLHPFTKFRVVQTCHAICPACGARYTYYQAERTFALETARPGTAMTNAQAPMTNQ
jgi:hypothetical protein